jgi:hypothetical protein
LLTGLAMLRKTVVLLVLAACSSTSSSDDTPAPDGGDPGARCEPADQVVALDPSATYIMRGAASDARGAWALLERRTSGAAGDLVIADESGELATLVSGLADLPSTEAAPLTVDGRRCIVYAPFNDTVRLACEGHAEEDSALDLEADQGRLVAIQSPDGVVHAYGQDFAAYTEARRIGPGSWRDIEKFESSISSAQDVLLRGADPIICLLATPGRPAIDDGADIYYSADRARWCMLVSTPSELGVLTDLGYTTFSGTSLGGWQPTSIDTRPLAMVSGAQPAAISPSAAGDAIQLVPLPSGEPTILRTADASSGDASSFSAVQQSADELVLFSLPFNGTSYSLAKSTRCLE